MTRREPAAWAGYVWRAIRAHPRLGTATLVALATMAALPGSWQTATRFLLGWDIGVALYLVLVLVLFVRSDVEGIRRQAARQDEGRIAILVLTALAAAATLAAILTELSTRHGDGRSAGQLALATTTLVLSWVFTHTIFALHYAHDCYGQRGGKSRGLNFPGEDNPDYWDFLYFAFVIGMTSQVSDVSITSREIRRTVNAHGILAFFFNAALLALTVNIAASAL